MACLQARGRQHYSPREFRGKKHEFISIFTLVSDGSQYPVLNKVRPWSSRLEGQIECSFSEMDIVFFDAGYAANRMYYRAEREYKFIFRGFAYTCEVKKEPEPIIISDRESIKKIY